MGDKRDLTSAVPEHTARWRGTVILSVLLFVATLLVYSQVVGFSLINLDDPAYVCPQVLQGFSLSNVAWSFNFYHDANWIPLTWLSLMLDTEFYGPRAGGYHLTNALLHSANAVVLFAALVLATGSRTKSGFVAALFALHPLHVESVAWVAERKDVLSTLFGMLALLAYVRYSMTGRRRTWWPAVSAMC